MSYIPWPTVLKKMRQHDQQGRAIPFDIEFFTLDYQRGTGGELLKVKSAIVSGLKAKSKTEVHQDKVSRLQNNSVTRNPNHNLHRTLNIIDRDRKFYKLHINLIYAFNGQKVIY